MDPLLAAAYSDTASGRARKSRKAEDAFYDRHGRRGCWRAFPAASAAVVMVALMVVAGLISQ